MVTMQALGSVSITEEWLREQHAAYLRQAAALKPILDTKIGDLTEQFSGKKLSELFVFGTSKRGWPQLVIGDPAKIKRSDDDDEDNYIKAALGGSDDYGFASVNAISDLLMLRLYGVWGAQSRIGEHVRFFDPSGGDERKVLYVKDPSGEWRCYDWHGYSWKEAPCVDEDHQVNTQALHTEIDALVGCLIVQRPYIATFVGSNAKRFTHRIAECMDMTVREARKLKADDFALAAAARKLNEDAQDYMEKNPAAAGSPVMVESIDVSTLQFPFTLRIEIPGVKPYDRLFKGPEDLWFIEGNKPLIDAGAIKVSLAG